MCEKCVLERGRDMCVKEDRVCAEQRRRECGRIECIRSIEGECVEG